MSLILLVVGIVLFIGLVVVHEYGHFITARRNGVGVEEFGIFFPPRLFKKKTKAGWVFSFNAIPLGGFVKLKGEHDSDTGQGTFGAASVWVKTKIMAAGVFMNLLVALFLFTVLAYLGMPKLVPNQFTVKSDTQLASRQVILADVAQGSPAQKAGLHSEDVLTDISLPGYSPVGIDNSDNLPNITKRFAGEKVKIYYVRSGKHRETDATLLSKKEVEKSNGSKGYLGIIPFEYTLQKSTWSSPVVALGLSAQMTGLTFQGIGHALGGLGSLIAGAITGNTTARQNGQTAASSQVSGPVGIFVILKNGSLLGYKFMLFIIAIISLTLAIMNILPIPALDGGRLWLTLATRGVKKPMSPNVEEAINIAGFILLISLIIVITLVDVKRFF
jgi:regulator of sigma E protease